VAPLDDQISNQGLQHAIDALRAANVDLRAKVDALRGTTLDLQHMLDSLELGVMLLDEELVLLQFNAMAAQFLDLDAQDLGNPVASSCRRLGSQLEAWCQDVSRSGRRAEHSCRSTIGEPLNVRIRGARVDGVARLILVFAEASSE
jgi:PAS domain-containing protein